MKPAQSGSCFPWPHEARARREIPRRNDVGPVGVTYVTAVAKVRGDKKAWENYEPFQQALGGNPIRLLTFKEMILEIQGSLTTTLAATEVGRMLQMFQAAEIHVEAD